jgi:(p)ppGpp synthase/HD superfamily hydrolase
LETKTRELVSVDPEIKKALEDMQTLHSGQYRKIDNVPFANHPTAVAKIISRVCNDTNVITA